VAYFFFSYARKDSAATQDHQDHHVEAMRANGFIIWQDTSEGDDGIDPGKDWVEAIEQGVRSPDCKGIILQWSKNAEASKWVAKEIQMGIEAGKTIYPILLDDTPLPTNIDRSNAVPSSELDRLMDALARHTPDAWRQKLPVDFDVKLGVQPDAKTWDRPLDGDSIVSVPLIKSSYTKACVVGSAEAVIGQPERILLCAEFTGRPNPRFLADAIRFFKQQYPGQPYIAVHATAKNIRRGEYHLNDHNYAEWVDAVDTCVQAVDYLRERCRCNPAVHLFAKTPVIFAALLGVRFPTQTTLYLYNDIPAQVGDGFTYSQIARIVTR